MTITTTRKHAPFVRSWPRTSTTPAEIAVSCICGRWSFDSQESISGGIEPWGDSWEAHVAEVEQ